MSGLITTNNVDMATTNEQAGLRAVLNEERRLRESQDKCGRRLCLFSAIIIILAVISVAVGCLGIALSAPKFTFPYCLGGAMIAGIMSIVFSCCTLTLFCNYKGMSHDAMKTWVRRMWFVIGFVCVSLVLGIGISGIMGMVQSSDNIVSVEKFNSTSYDVEYETKNRSVAIASFLLVLVLSIAHMLAWCHICGFLEAFWLYRNQPPHSFTSLDALRQQELLQRNAVTTRATNHATRDRYSVPSQNIHATRVPNQIDNTRGVPFQINNARGGPIQVNRATGVPIQANHARRVPIQVNNARGVPIQVNYATGVPIQANHARRVLIQVNNARGVPIQINNARGVPIQINNARRVPSQANPSSVNRHLVINPEIYQGDMLHYSVPNLPTGSPGTEEGREIRLSPNANRHAPSANTDNSTDIPAMPPPSYEELEGDSGLPSYRDVTEGRYLSTGHTENATKL